MLTDDELLDFDTGRLTDFDPRKAEQALEEHGELFRSHLTIARWLDFWREGMSRPSIAIQQDPERQEGINYALRELAAHLRQGDFLPGGTLYEDEVNRPS